LHGTVDIAWAPSVPLISTAGQSWLRASAEPTSIKTRRLAGMKNFTVAAQFLARLRYDDPKLSLILGSRSPTIKSHR
jgi:hypothetical protein